MARGPGMRELGAEEYDQGRVVDPDEEHHHRARRTIGRADASPSQARETDYPFLLHGQGRSSVQLMELHRIAGPLLAWVKRAPIRRDPHAPWRRGTSPEYRCQSCEEASSPRHTPPTATGQVSPFAGKT